MIESIFGLILHQFIENKNIAKKPKPFVRFQNFGDSALEFEMIFWSKSGFVIDNVKSDLRRAVYKKLTESGLAIPFPQRDVNIKGWEKIKPFDKTTEQ